MIDLTLAILAGGQGKRLGGRDKGKLRFDGKTLVERLHALAPLFTETRLIDSDVVPNKGSPGGVVTALLQASTSRVLVVCCDMPFVTQQAVQQLASVEGGAFFEGPNGEPEPFPGIYRAAWGQTWLGKLEQNPSMRKLLSGVDLHTLPLSDPRVVRSVNTFDDAKLLGVDIP